MKSQTPPASPEKKQTLSPHPSPKRSYSMGSTAIYVQMMKTALQCCCMCGKAYGCSSPSVKSVTCPAHYCYDCVSSSEQSTKPCVCNHVCPLLVGYHAWSMNDSQFMNSVYTDFHTHKKLTEAKAKSLLESHAQLSAKIYQTSSSAQDAAMLTACIQHCLSKLTYDIKPTVKASSVLRTEQLVYLQTNSTLKQYFCASIIRLKNIKIDFPSVASDSVISLSQ